MHLLMDYLKGPVENGAKHSFIAEKLEMFFTSTLLAEM